MTSDGQATADAMMSQSGEPAEGRVPDRSDHDMLRALIDKDQIRDVLYTYSRAIDRADLALLKSVYHPDGVDVHGSTFAGNAHEFCEYIFPRLRALQISCHLIGNILIDLQGDEAFCESYYFATIRTASADGRVADIASTGRYLDVMRRCEDLKWRIFHRLVVNDKRWASLVPQRDLDAYEPASDVALRPSNDERDLVYRGFAITDVLPSVVPDDKGAHAVFDRFPRDPSASSAGIP